MDSRVKQSWEEFLNPDIQRSRLISAAIFIATFQSLKDSIIDRARGLFWRGFDSDGELFDPEYHTEVLSRNKSAVHASLDWLQEQAAIDASDVATFDRIKQCRNHLSHELLNVICSTGLPADYDERFSDLSKLLRKIEVWWIKNVEEVPDGVDDSEIIPGRVMNLDLLCRIGLEGNSYFYDEMQKHLKSAPT